jgi:hypothetical protein
MFKNLLKLGVVGAIVGTSLIEAPVLALGSARRVNFVTFTGPVRIPGVVLAGGSYAFERLDTNIVRVMNRDRSIVYLTAFTMATIRPSGAAGGQVMSLGESTDGTPPPVVAWYPLGESQGYRFIYW